MLVQTQEQQQRQIQTATMQQMQLSRLLELPVDAMDEEIRKATDENQALEREDYDDEMDEGREPNDVNMSAFADRQDDRRVRRSSEEGDSFESWTADAESDADVLLQQISELDLNDTERTVMEYIAGSLNDDGYLEKDDLTLCDELAFGRYINVPEEEMHRLVGIFQTLDPPGIAAHSLQECVGIQLKNKREEIKDNGAQEAETLDAALRIVEGCFDDYANHRWDRLAEKMEMTQADIEAAHQMIRHCNPSPGSVLTAATQRTASTITPDFFLTVDENEGINIELARGHEPRLRVSQTYLDIVEHYALLTAPSRQQQEDYIYAKDHVDRAKAYLDNLRRRRDTLLRTMREIARRQRPFFLHEDDETYLQPMKLQDIAEKVGVDISTISRAANSKYVETIYGVYPLRLFFNAQTMEKDGQQVSSTQVKVALRELIENENPALPLSDEQLVAALSEQGYKIARRTVAKYRGQLGILPVNLRTGANKKLKIEN